jgi:predicted RNA-binding Zn-ribbon protein involved in translation (DUF1610 family)
MENYTDFELMISRSINKLHDARRKAEAIEAPTIDSTPEAPTIPVNADVTLPKDHCPMCGLGPHAPISQGLVVIDNEMNLNPKLAKHYSCRGCGWFWCVEGRHEREGN